MTPESVSAGRTKNLQKGETETREIQEHKMPLAARAPKENQLQSYEILSNASPVSNLISHSYLCLSFCEGKD